MLSGASQGEFWKSFKKYRVLEKLKLKKSPNIIKGFAKWSLKEPQMLLGVYKIKIYRALYSIRIFTKFNFERDVGCLGRP